MTQNDTETIERTSADIDGETLLCRPKFPFAMLFCIWLLVVVTTTVVTFLMPESYVSSARIKVEPDQAEMGGFLPNQTFVNNYDPYVVQTEFEVIQSEVVLGKVIEDLKLRQQWGTKFGSGSPLTFTEAMAVLKGSIDVKPVRNSTLIEIRVYSDKPEQAAQLANAIAEAYRDYRMKARAQRISAGIRTLGLAYEENQQQAQRIGAELAEMQREQSGSNSNRLVQAKKRLEEVQGFGQSLFWKIGSEKTELGLPANRMVQIVDTAHPGFRPVRPKKPLNLAVGIVGGMASGFILSTLVYVLQWRAFCRRAGKPEVPLLRRFRSIVYLLGALIVASFIGYCFATPSDFTSLIAVPSVLFVGGMVAAIIALANLKA